MPDWLSHPIRPTLLARAWRPARTNRAALHDLDLSKEGGAEPHASQACPWSTAKGKLFCRCLAWRGLLLQCSIRVAVGAADLKFALTYRCAP
jgi:hypothetical protein